MFVECQVLMLAALQQLPVAVVSPEDAEECYVDLLNNARPGLEEAFGRCLHTFRSMCRFDRVS
jgi:hypothetical protein